MPGFLKNIWIDKRCKNGEIHPSVCKYLRENHSSNIIHFPLESVRFVVLDTEATGLDPKKDALLSIGGISVLGNEICIGDSFEGVIHSNQDAVRDTVHIHGILPSDSAAGREEEDVLLAFLEYLKDSVFVAHNAGFDRAILGESLQRYWGVGIQNRVLDTMFLARRLDDASKLQDHFRTADFSLDTLASEYGFDLVHRHKAWGDALITARLLLILLQRARKRGIITLRELLRNPGNGLL